MVAAVSNSLTLGSPVTQTPKNEARSIVSSPVSSQDNIPCVVNLKRGRRLVILGKHTGKRLSTTLRNGTKVVGVDFIGGDGPSGVVIAVIRNGNQLVLGRVLFSDLRCKFS